MDIMKDMVVIDKAIRPTAEDVLAYIDEFQGQEDDAEQVRDFVQAAARMVASGNSLYDFGMAGYASFVEFYWSNTRLSEVEMQSIRRIASSFVLPPLATAILSGQRDNSLAVDTVRAGFVAGKRSVKP